MSLDKKLTSRKQQATEVIYRKGTDRASTAYEATLGSLPVTDRRS